MAREVIYSLSTRTDRTDCKSSIGSVNKLLRCSNCISLVGPRIFSWQKSVDKVCRSKEITRIAKLVRGVVGLLQDFFGKALPRAHGALWFSCEAEEDSCD